MLGRGNVLFVALVDGWQVPCQTDPFYFQKRKQTAKQRESEKSTLLYSWKIDSRAYEAEDNSEAPPPPIHILLGKVAMRW